eukprot:PhM_4_TR7630/c4_g1_i1/m.2181
MSSTPTTSSPPPPPPPLTQTQPVVVAAAALSETDRPTTTTTITARNMTCSNNDGHPDVSNEMMKSPTKESTSPKTTTTSTTTTTTTTRVYVAPTATAAITSTSSAEATASSELNYFLSTFVQPNEWSLHARRRVFALVEKTIRECAASQGIPSRVDVMLFGSFYLSTYLPDGDVDITVRCPLEEEASFMSRLHADLQRRHVHVTFVQAEVKLLKCLCDGIYVDVSFNQLTGVAAGRFVHDADMRLGNHILKKSLLVVKAWAYYESHILGGNGGLLGTYAITMMLLTVMNRMSQKDLLNSATTPLEVLRYFLRFYAENDITTNVVTIYGLAPNHDGAGPVEPVSDAHCIIDRPFVQSFVQRNTEIMGTTASRPPSPQTLSASPPEGDKSPPRGTTPPPATGVGSRLADFTFECRDRPLNIADPLKPSNNLGRGVHRCHAVRIQMALQYGHRRLEEVMRCIEDGTPAGADPNEAPSILHFFERTVRACMAAHAAPQQHTQGTQCSMQFGSTSSASAGGNAVSNTGSSNQQQQQQQQHVRRDNNNGKQHGNNSNNNHGGVGADPSSVIQQQQQHMSYALTNFAMLPRMGGYNIPASYANLFPPNSFPPPPVLLRVPHQHQQQQQQKASKETNTDPVQQQQQFMHHQMMTQQQQQQMHMHHQQQQQHQHHHYKQQQQPSPPPPSPPPPVVIATSARPPLAHRDPIGDASEGALGNTSPCPSVPGKYVPPHLRKRDQNN